MIVLTEAVDFYVFRRNNPLCHTETNPIENVVTVRFDDHLGIRVSSRRAAVETMSPKMS